MNSGDVWVSIDSGADYDKTFASIEDAVADVQGVRSDVITYSEQKIRDVGALRDGQNLATGDGLDVLTGSDKPLVVRVFGEKFDVLAPRGEQGPDADVADRRRRRSARRAADDAAQRRDRGRSRQGSRSSGSSPATCAARRRPWSQGLIVGSVFEDQKVFEVVVKGTPETRRSIADIRNLLLDTPGGGHVRLGQVADVRIADVPISIPRDKVSRYLDVKADVSGRSLDSVANELEDRLQQRRRSRSSTTRRC